MEFRACGGVPGGISSYSPTQNCNGKIHLAAAIGFALVENGRRVLFMRTGELVQRLQIIADRCQSAVRRVRQGVPRPGHDLAAIDRLMHYVTILEMNVESYRCGAALNRKRSRLATSARDTKRKRLIVAQRQSTCHSATIKNGYHKNLAKRDHRHDHLFATDRRFTLRLPLPFSDCRTKREADRGRGVLTTTAFTTLHELLARASLPRLLKHSTAKACAARCAADL